MLIETARTDAVSTRTSW